MKHEQSFSFFSLLPIPNHALALPLSFFSLSLSPPPLFSNSPLPSFSWFSYTCHLTRAVPSDSFCLTGPFPAFTAQLRAQSYQRAWCWHWCGPTYWRPHRCSSHSRALRHWRRWVLREKVCFPLWPPSFLQPVWDQQERDKKGEKRSWLYFSHRRKTDSGTNDLLIAPFLTSWWLLFPPLS